MSDTTDTTETAADELRAQKIAEAEAGLEHLVEVATQRDWLNITRALDRTRAEIFADSGLKLLALAWIKDKHEHGGASLDRLLDLTDNGLLTLHGFPVD